MSQHRLHPLFHPRAVAVVGASPKGGYGLTTLQNLRALDFPGSLHVVHPTHPSVDGVAAVPRLRDLPEVPDAVAVAVPAAAVPGVLAEVRELGVRAGVVYASGFAETGEAGATLQREVVEACGDDLAVVGPNCLGVASYRGRAGLWGITMPFAHAETPGSVAIAAQSGNMALTTMMSGRLPGLAYAVSLGNQANVDLSDCLEYFLTDPHVRVVALIAEGVSDLVRLRRLADRAAAQEVAVVLLKVGRSARGVAATVAHTGTLAGSDAVYAALAEQSGIVRVDDLDELVAVCSLMATRHRPRGRGLGIFASSGGECGLVADLADDHDVLLPELDAAALETLGSVLPAYGAPGNPLDLTAGGWGQFDVYATATRGLATCPGVEVVAFVGDSPSLSGSLEVSGWPDMLFGAGKSAAETETPVCLVTTVTDTVPELARLCEQAGVVLLSGLQPALRAISLAGRHAEQRRRDVTSSPPPDVDGRADAARRLLSTAAGPLSETRSKQVLAAYGLPVPDGELAPDVANAVSVAERIGYPVVCKVEANGLAHKSDVGGVVVGAADAEAVRAAAEQVLAAGVGAVGAEAVIGIRVERLAAAKGVELIVGGQGRRPGVPAMVVVGAGGVLTELLDDSVPLVWPFDRNDVERALSRLRVDRLLRGFRGTTPVDREAVVDAVVAVGRLLHALPEVAELDVNPLLATSSGCLALDALVVVDPAQRHTTPPDPDEESR